MSKSDARAQFRAPVGTRDIVPPESAGFQRLVNLFAEHARLAGYGLVVSPLFEEVGVFARGVGTSTDIVAKEMYEFEDKGGRSMALRPEGTASVVRSFVENPPPVLPWKVWYWGPMFRYERPQAGRYRQFHQVGAEAIGTDDPEADVEMIALAWDYFEGVGVGDKTLSINSLGDARCRPDYREKLMVYLAGREEDLCAEHRKRYRENPLRVLDCKKAECVAATSDAPRQVDSLCAECEDAFGRVTTALAALSIDYVLQPRLVRGLDYYTRTTFEIAAGSLDAAQNAIGGGGRYDGLVESLGGPPTPAVGFSAGIERVALALVAERGTEQSSEAPDVFVVDLCGGVASVLARDLRRAGIAVARDFGGRSTKAQFKAADRSGARFALVVGPDEVAAGTVSLKSLREADASPGSPRPENTQTALPRATIAIEMKRILS